MKAFGWGKKWAFYNNYLQEVFLFVSHNYKNLTSAVILECCLQFSPVLTSAVPHGSQDSYFFKIISKEYLKVREKC